MPHQNKSTPHYFNQGIDGYVPTAYISTKLIPMMFSYPPVPQASRPYCYPRLYCGNPSSLWKIMKQSLASLMCVRYVGEDQVFFRANHVEKSVLC